jgi:hypothetical protein
MGRTAGCQDYMPGTSAVWFKITAGGRDGTSNTWADTPLMVSGNSGYTYTIPSCLKAGYYLVRHEIIALHAACELLPCLLVVFHLAFPSS